jgi:hypothetical protein
MSGQGRRSAPAKAVDKTDTPLPEWMADPTKLPKKPPGRQAKSPPSQSSEGEGDS